MKIELSKSDSVKLDVLSNLLAIFLGAFTFAVLVLMHSLLNMDMIDLGYSILHFDDIIDLDYFIIFTGYSICIPLTIVSFYWILKKPIGPNKQNENQSI